MIIFTLAAVATVIHPSTELVSFLIGIVIPLATGLVTKLDAHPAVKVVVNSVLIVVTGILTTLVNEPDKGLPLYDTFYAIVFAAVSSWGTYARIWRPAGVTTAIQTRTAKFGLG
jgi:Trk-type K+ transport system membrane component